MTHRLWACIACLTAAMVAHPFHAFTLDERASAVTVFDPQALWEDHSTFERSTMDPALLQPEDMHRFVTELVEANPGLFELEHLTDSAEGRPIQHVTFGEGPTPVLVWARQHGDEKLCSAAMMDFLGFWADRHDTPLGQTLRDNLTIHIVPMVNPDGVARLTRRNALDIDPNRDARLVQTPAGFALRSLYERCEPAVCFNMHDQSPRKSTDDTGELIALSLQACPFDRAETLGPQLLRAKTISGYMADTLTPWIGGHIARYEANYMPRAFGDSMSRWGVASVLIESGGWFGPKGDAEEFIARCHFLALMSGLVAAATNADSAVSPERYDMLPLEGRPHSDLMIRGALVIGGQGLQPMVADVSINRNVDERGGNILHGSIRDLGDMGIFRGREEIDASEMIATPALTLWDPATTPETLADPARVRALHSQGISTVIGTCSRAGARALVAPTERLPIRGFFFETIGSVEEAASRSFLTDAHGIRIPLGAVGSETVESLVPGVSLGASAVQADLLLVNRGRPSRNLALVVLGEERSGGGEAPDLQPVLDLFDHRAVAVIIGADGWREGLVDGQRAHLFAPGAPTFPAIVQSASEDEGWEVSPLIHTFTEKISDSLALEDLGGIRRGRIADITLWSLEAGSSDEPEAIRFGDALEVVVEGHRF